MSKLDGVRRILEVRPHLRLAYVFGSVGRGQGRPRSDLDIAVLFGESPPPGTIDRLIVDLEAALGRTVDLVVLDTAPPLLVHEVISTGKLLLCRDEDERVGFEARAVARYLDTGHLRDVQHAYLRERAEAHRAGTR
jgi:uncharacterized protein